MNKIYYLIDGVQQMPSDTKVLNIVVLSLVKNNRCIGSFAYAMNHRTSATC